MGSVYLLVMLAGVVPSISELSDHLSVYQKDCLGEDKVFCSDGTCVWNFQYCDGKIDCPDGSDENLCVDHTPSPELCLSSEAHFLCTDKKKCIPNTWICNNVTDCDDASDETDCTVLDCSKSSNHFECADKSECIPKSLVCDGVGQCDDDSDEVNCSKRPIATNQTQCKGFRCKSDQRCISSLWVCDGTYDCDDQSDEFVENCRSTLGHIIPFVACPEDERGGLPAKMTGHFKRMYPCRDDSQCLDNRRMCDGTHDCKDGSDEEEFCNTWHTMCNNKTCKGDSICRPEPSGVPKCECNRYYHVYNETSEQCEPVDACAEPRPQCSHSCKDNKGSHICFCDEGYTSEILKLNFICFAPDPEAMLFFTTPNDVKYITLKSKKMVTIASGVKQAHGVAFDGIFVYWVETAQGQQAIVRAPLDNLADTKTVLVGLGLEDPGDISIDFIGGNFYFSDAERGTITACSSQTQVCTTIKTDARVPKHLTLDTKHGKMYWADYHDKAVIMSAWMDGSEPRVLVDKLRSFPGGLAVDAPGGRLYFIDHTLKGVLLTNGHIFTVNPRVPTYHEPRALTVFENYIYWSDWASNTIQNWTKVAGNSPGPFLTLDAPVYGLYMFHPILTKSARHPQLVNCSHIRLIGPGDAFVCACPDGMELDDTKHNCRPMQDYRPEYVVIGSGSTFTRVQYNSVGGQPSAAVPFDIGRVQTMAYDSLRDVLYFYDVMWKAISSVNMSDFHRGTAQMTYFMGLDNVIDMDYDYITDNLYILDAGRKFVEAISLRTSKRVVIHKFDHEIPKSMCVIPEYGKMFVAVSESEQDDTMHLDSFGLDGSAQRHLIMNNLKGPRISLKFSRKMDAVYIADEGNNVIDYMHPEGTGLENFRELSTFVSGLALTETLVLWTTSRSRRLYWADIHDWSRNIRRVELTMFTPAVDLHILATWKPASIAPHPCQQHPCSDVCVQTPRHTDRPNTAQIDYATEGFNFSIPTAEPDKEEKLGYRCLCPPGLMKVDETCSELVTCDEDEVFCRLSNQCVKNSTRCDGKRDCQHGEDEDGCESSTVRSTSTVSPKKCGPGLRWCRHMRTCLEKEIACPVREGPECPGLQFRCSGAHCIERSRLCDGTPDCPNGGDEGPLLCMTLYCYKDEFLCSSGQCIKKLFVCDGDADCTDGSDEFNCVNKTCPPNQYQCRNLQCIDITRRCDAQQDCADYSDEDDCVYPFAGQLFPEPEKEQPELENCPEWEFACELNRTLCLPFSTRCNGYSDCPGSTDEVDCDKSKCNHHRLVSCDKSRRCIPASMGCDGHRDCEHGEDEAPEVCAKKGNNTVKPNIPIAPSVAAPPVLVFPSEECHDGYLCSDGQCIEWSNVCNKQTDCADGSDEEGLCATSCNDHSCLYICQPTPLGHHCQCPEGYKLAADSLSCEDVDECAQGLCSQHCHNTPGSFLCSCHWGYALRPDRRSCKATKGNVSILYVSGDTVRSMSFDAHFAQEYKDDNGIIDIDYDVRNKTLYVTSPGKLTEVNSTHKIDITNIGKPDLVSLDWITGNVYFTDLSERSPRIRVCNVPKKRCALLQKLPQGSKVTSLVIDPSSSRKLFYSVERDSECVIYSSSLAGRRAMQVVITKGCGGIAVDSFSKKIYVADSDAGNIYTMDYQGEHHNDILKDKYHLQAPRDLTLFEDHVYYLDGKSSKLGRCLLFGKKHCEMFYERVFEGSSLVFNHESVQRDDITNYCEGMACDNLCVQGELAGICLCDDGTVSKDGKCPLPVKETLPVFNGAVSRDYQSPHVAVSIVVTLFVLTMVASAAFFVHRWYLKKRAEQAANYLPVHFQNSMAEDTPPGGTSRESVARPAPPDPTVLMPEPLPTTTTSRTSEFINPIEYFRNLRQSFRARRPIGTAGLEINVPDISDKSDTESDQGDKERNVL